MDTSTILWIVGIAIVVVLFYYTNKAYERKKGETTRSQSNNDVGRVESPQTPNVPDTPRSADTPEISDVSKTFEASNPSDAPKADETSTVPPKAPRRPTTIPPINQMAAKTAFMDNIQRFIPKLNSLLDGSYNGNDWTDDVIDINESNLIEYWKKAYKESRSVLRLLSVWGLKPDMCTSFVCMDLHKEMYDKADGSSIETGLTYKVIKHCWLLTQTKPDGRVEKKVIIKGVVE